MTAHSVLLAATIGVLGLCTALLRAIAIALVAATVENVGYRQLTVGWRLEGWWASLRGRGQVWGVMTRTGFDEGRS